MPEALTAVQKKAFEESERLRLEYEKAHNAVVEILNPDQRPGRRESIVFSDLNAFLKSFPVAKAKEQQARDAWEQALKVFVQKCLLHKK